MTMNFITKHQNLKEKRPKFEKHKSDELRKMAIHTDFFTNAPLQEQAEIWNTVEPQFKRLPI